MLIPWRVFAQRVICGDVWCVCVCVFFGGKETKLDAKM